MTTKSIFCEVCALICHEECKKSAFSCPPKVNDQQPSYDVSNQNPFPFFLILNPLLFNYLVGLFCQDL